MPMTAIQRQQKFREKKKLERAKRLDMLLDLSTSIKLEDMALHANETKKDFLTRLIDREYSRMISNNENGFDDWSAELNRERVAQAIADDNDNLDLFENSSQ